MVEEQGTKRAARVPRDPLGTIQRIIAAAQDEFGEHGFDGARMEHVANRAAVSKQLLYRYFPSKEELYGELVRGISGRNHEEMLKIDFAALDPQTAIRRYVGGVFDCFASDPSAAAITMDQCAKGGAQFKFGPEGRRLREKMRTRIAEVIDRGRAAGIVAPDMDAADFEYMTMIVTASCVSSRGAFARHLGRKTFDEKNADYWREYAVNFIARAIRP